MASKLLDKHHETASRLIPEHSQRLTVDKLRALLPTRTSVAITEEILALANRMEEDTGLPQELLEEDLMSYMYILGNIKGIGVKDLINAVKFCNLKRNYGNKEAWAIVFPDKYNALVEGNKQVDNHVSMYNSSRIVSTIDKEMLIPVHLQYAPYFHAAVKKQFDIMNGKAGKDAAGKLMTVSPMVIHLAAKELANLTKPPEESKISISVNPSESAMTMQQEMNQQLNALVSMQKKRLDAGGDIIDIQQVGIDFEVIGRGENQ